MLVRIMTNHAERPFGAVVLALPILLLKLTSYVSVFGAVG